MKRLGTVSHYAKQGFLVVRCESVPELNSRVVDKELTVVGFVKDVFGPIGYPYAAVKPKVKNPEGYVGKFLYVDDRDRRRSRASRFKRSKSGHHHRTSRQLGHDRRGKRPTPKRRG